MAEFDKNRTRAANWFFGPGGGDVGQPNAIGMPGSEVYPPAPAGNKPYNPVGDYVKYKAGETAAPFLLPGQVYNSPVPVTTNQMIVPALGLAALGRLNRPSNPAMSASTSPLLPMLLKKAEEKVWDTVKDKATGGGEFEPSFLYGEQRA